MAAQIQADVKDFIAKAQEKLPKVGDQLKLMKLELFELYAITVLYLGALQSPLRFLMEIMIS